jgi:hypothetical protein
VKVNLNNQVRVRLTESGMRQMRAYWGKSTEHMIKDGNSFKTELWSLMSIFGAELHNGSIELPFVGNEVEFLTPPERPTDV